MLKQILASTALATLLAGGAYAQTAAEPAPEPAAPLIEGPDSAAEPMADPASPDLAQDETVQDETVAPDAATPPEVVEDASPSADTLTTETDPVGGEASDTMAADEWAPVDLAAISTDGLIGADIVTGENETVATVEDVLITDDGAVENVVAKFGGFLGFGADSVLLTVDEIEVMQDPDENLLVRTSLTPEDIASRPIYE